MLRLIGSDDVTPLLFATPTGWALLIVGTLIGGLFAAFSFAVSIFAIPMPMAEHTDALTAMESSMALVWNKSRCDAALARHRSRLFILSVVTGLMGLIVVFPCSATPPDIPTRQCACRRTPTAGTVASWQQRKEQEGELLRPVQKLSHKRPAYRPLSPSREEVLLASRTAGDSLRQTDLSIPAIHCGGCIHTIERALGARW